MASVVTNDGVLFELDSNFIQKCKMLSYMFEDSNNLFAAPLHNVSSDVMNKILNYHKTGSLENDDTTLHVLLACDFLAYEELLDHGCKMVAESLRGKSAKEIRNIFGLAPPQPKY